MNSKYKRLICDMGLFALGAIGSKLITFLLLPLYTHILTTNEYGIADLIFTFGQLLLPFISLAIFNGLLRFGLMQDVKPENALLCATKVFIYGSIAAILLTPLLGMIPSVGNWKWFLCVHIISSFAVVNSLVYLKVKDKNKLYALFSILQTLILVLCNLIFLVLLDYGIQGYILSYIISNITTSAVIFVSAGMIKDFKAAEYHPELMKAMILFSLPYILNDIAWWMIQSSNKLIVEFMLGSSLLGIYTTSSKIPSLINVVSSIFSQAWRLSSIREYDSSNDAGFYSKVFHCFIITIFAVCIGTVSIIKPFMKIYVAANYFTAWRYIPILLLAAVFLAISAFAGSLLGAMKKSQTLMWTTLFACTVNVVLNFVMIPICGLWGAVLGTLAANIIVAFFRLIYVRKHLKISYNIKNTTAIILLSTIHVSLVSMDFHINIVSAAVITVFLILIHKDLVSLIAAATRKKYGKL